MRPQLPRAFTAVLIAGALSLSLSSCSGSAADVPNTDNTLVIGISGTQPGLSLDGPDGPKGFDIDVATYVAHQLGWTDSEIEFKQLDTAQRPTALESGAVDMVVAAYSITPERMQDVDFAGPYFIAGQDLMVAVDDADITGPHSLDGKVLCSTAGSTSAATIKTAEYSAGVTLKEYPDNAACADALLNGEVDAMTGDDIILAGFVARNPGKLKVVGSPFSTESYGIGLPKGSPDVAVINDVLNQFVDDGTWKADFDKNLAASGYSAPMPPVAGQ
ncbi:glutamate ABC transporter substrate-binding protein [soil metagenome]